MKKIFKECSKRGVSFLLALTMMFSMAEASGLSELALLAYAEAPEQSELAPESEQGPDTFLPVEDMTGSGDEQQDPDATVSGDIDAADDGENADAGEGEQLPGDTGAVDEAAGDTEESPAPEGSDTQEPQAPDATEPAAPVEGSDEQSTEDVVAAPEDSNTEPQENEAAADQELAEGAETDLDSTEAEDDFSDLMTIEELLALDEDVAGATIEKVEQPPFMLMNLVQGEHWAFDVYYVNEKDSNSVHETDNFSLKYQMEFNASQDFNAKEVEIRIPAMLFKDRNGSPVMPNDIAVPKVDSKDADPIVVRNSPFNYYVENVDGVDYLVFFNYKEIISGTNSAWQVVYSKLNAMKIIDDTKWSLTATVNVDYTPEPSITVPEPAPVHEEANPEPLTGDVDTQALLTSLTKTPYTNTNGKSYCPGLYTENQVKQYINGDIPAKYAGDNFGNYYYVVWEVRVRGNGNQPFDLWFKDTSDHDGEIVGYKKFDYDYSTDTANISNTTNTVPNDYSAESKTNLSGASNLHYKFETRSWQEKYYVVTAYDSSKVNEGDLLKNEVEAILVPTDLVDAPQSMNDSATWNYAKYHWNYKGDTLSINKQHLPIQVPELKSKTYSGWLDAYKESQKGNEDVADNFDFESEGISRTYKATHTIDENGKLGERIPGKVARVSVVDDAVYAFPNGTDTNNQTLLDKEDYYFADASVTLTEYGYDPFEDAYNAPETANPEEGINQDLKIYAMFAKDGTGDGTTPNCWELVDTVKWDSRTQSSAYAKLTYKLPAEVLAREPYRIMAVHDSIGYEVSIKIDVSLCIRHDSPKVEKLLKENPDIVAIEFENIAGLDGDVITNGTPNDGVGTETYFGGTVKDFGREKYAYTTDGLYGYDNIPGLEDFSKKLYGGPIIRDDSVVLGQIVGRNAYAAKTSESSNDALNGRVNVVYNITAYDGYEIDSNDMANYLIAHGLTSPARNSVVFYDLLPYGMKYDPSYRITAGRVTNIRGNYQTQPKSWDASNIDVQASVISSNYNNTGRTMMAFTVTYKGENAATFQKDYFDSKGYLTGRFFEGWGISYRGYWNWEDVGISSKSRNVCAIMPAKDDNSPFIAGEGQAYNDDGVTPEGYQDDYKYFGKDIDGDGLEEPGCVLYAHILSPEDVAMASTSTITKLVRADADRYSIFDKSAVVEVGGGYTYEITVNNASRPIHNIVIFDHLENALQDRESKTFDDYSPIPDDIEFEDDCWTGTFSSVITEGLLELGITPTVYYNENRDAKLPSAHTDPKGVLTEGNGWYTESRWTSLGKPLSSVKSVAVDLGDYTLGSMESVSFRICMKAPEEMQEQKWAYNSPSFCGEVVDSGVKQSVVGNSVKVRMGESESIEVIKKITNKADAPASVQNQNFEFFAYELGESGAKLPYADKEYALYSLDDMGEWVKDSQMYGTNANGKFTLKDNQKAVFSNVADAERVYIEETENPFWKVTVEDVTDGGKVSHTFSNEYRPVLYVKKVASAVPQGYTTADAAFTMQAMCNGAPAANVPFWYVTAAYTDGRLPNRVAGKDEGVTDDNGYFTIHPGEIVALLGPGKVGDTYTVTETDTGADWVCKAPKVEGSLNKNGSSVTITNYYKWKDILLKKAITHQDVEDAADTGFTFKVEHIETAADGSEIYTPVVGNDWILEVKDDELQNEQGVLGPDGTFICHAAKGTIRIRHLEAEQEYRITEVLPDDSFYLAMNNGEADVKMPLYSTSVSASITNDWQKRPLSVTKTLLYDLEDADRAAKAKTAVFEMTIQSDTNGDGEEELLTDFPFTLTQAGKAVEPGSENDPYVVNGGASHSEFKTDENGKFLIMGGQTATFEDAGIKGSTFTVTETPNDDFLQVYPTGNQPQKGSFDTEGQKTSIINGSADGLLITKEWSSDDAIGDEIIEKATGASSELYKALSIHLTMKVKKDAAADAELVAWPETDTDVSIVDAEGNISSATWKKASGDGLGGLDIHAGESVAIVSGLDDVVAYEVTETRASEADESFWCSGVMRKYKANDKKQYWVSVEQVVPEDGRGVLTGTIEENPAVTFVNNIKVNTEASEIYKRMTKDSSVVPNNSKIVFIVEKYGADGWTPAADIEYMLPTVTRNADGQKVTVSNEDFVTGADGKIVIETWSDTYPYIVFMNEDVHILDVLEPSDGDLRIRELMGESDSEWGMFVGIGGIKDNEEYTMDLTKYVEHTEGGIPVAAFVNSNADKPIRVGKDVEGASDSTFTMVLDQITGVDGDRFDSEGGITPANYSDVITETVAGKGIGYSIYDAMTGEYIGSGVTDENGHITLKAGQYAELGLPNETMWTVSEQVTPKFVLKEMSSQNGDSRLRKLADNLMLVGASAAWNKPYEATYDVKYAVSIYGIKQDYTKPVDGKDMYGNVTFGPATGADYTHSYVACPGTSEDDPGNCMHWMTWEEIAEIAQDDPESLRPCLENGCTHAVELKFEDDTILGESYSGEMNDGDGASILYNSIGKSYRKWNNTNYNYGGWAASRVRAVLNGADEYTADGTDVNDMGSRIYYPDGDAKNEAGTDMASFTADKALISAFPAELRDAIVAKAVVADTKYNDYTTTNYTATMYDKLWCFSGAEVYQDSSSNRNVIRHNEGLTGNTEYYDHSPNNGFDETGSANNWWLRTAYRSNNLYVCGIYASGDWNYTNAYNTNFGVAPGFCLGTSEAPREYDVKYAVSIYGIKQDYTESVDGQYMYGNVTFGPATGADYTHSYVACDGTSEENPGNCMHWMTWEEIAEIAQNDPESFRACLEHGCTHSVELAFKDKTILGTSYKHQMDDGDGASILYNSIGKSYRKWNNTNYNYGGWAASRVRAVLNGADEYTADGTDVNDMGGRIYYPDGDAQNEAGTDMASFTADKALISAFPEELQEAIAPKAVVADTKCDDYKTTDYTATTYDKLWYFSTMEIRTDTAGGSHERSNEGLTGDNPYYDRADALGINSSGTAKLKGFYETGSSSYWWLRSANRNYYGTVSLVSTSGDWYSTYASDTYGVAPGFCLGTSEAPKPQRPYDVKYAVSIYGINQDKGQSGETLALTFGPATGADYTHSYVACDGTSEGHPGNCMHWMTWDEIIAKARTDPESFRACLEHGCTHSVELAFMDRTNLGTSYKHQMDDGDGASVLRESIYTLCRQWNDSFSTYGGWAASRARAILNGADEYTADGTDVNDMGGLIYYPDGDAKNEAGTDMARFTEAKALISAFPTELQEAIAPKAVVADTKYDDRTTTDYTATTYDKLWCFSKMEIQTNTSASPVRSNEGLTGTTPYYDRANALRINSSDMSKLIGFIETGSPYYWRLRTIDIDAGYIIGIDYSDGNSHYEIPDTLSGVAFGFCIN